MENSNPGGNPNPRGNTNRAVIRVNPTGKPTPLQIIPPPTTTGFNALPNPNPLIIEWRHLAPPPVIELSSSDDESDLEDEDPLYGPFYKIDDVGAYGELRRSKRIWENVNNNGGKRIKYFPQKKKKRDY